MWFDMELWKDILTFKNMYQVSSLGRVKSLDRLNSRNQKIKGQILRPGRSTQGYLQVGLWTGGKRTMKNIHQLVAECFMPPKPKGLLVLHGVNGKEDNSVSNLSYGTQSKNCFDKYRDNTMICKSILCSNGHTYPSIRIASRELCIAHSGIINVLKGRQITAGNLKWEYMAVKC